MKLTTRLTAVVIGVFALVFGAFGQMANLPDVSWIKIPPLAEQAGVQGMVIINSDGQPVNGHPLLIPTALAAWKKVGLSVDTTYHFLLQLPQVTCVDYDQRRGSNRFTRFLWTLIGRGNTERPGSCGCTDISDSGLPPNTIEQTGERLQIVVYGKRRCLQTEAATLKAAN